MKTMQTAAVLAIWALSVSACTPGEQAPAAPAAEAPAAVAPDVPKLPAGDYKLDRRHASVTFKVNHLGFAFYTGQFETFDAILQLDPANPETTKVTATIDMSSLSIPNPLDGFVAELLGENRLGANITPQAMFTSTSVKQTGPATGGTFWAISC